MKTLTTLALGTALLFGTSLGAHAEDFTSHHLVEPEDYAAHVEQLPAEEKLDVRHYLDYEEREPCQNYRSAPADLQRDECNLGKNKPPQVANLKVNNVISDYEVHFAFDSAKIEPAAGKVLDTVSREIKRYQPHEVTVAGHADKAGPADYNMQLSERRAQAVSEALTQRGVTNRILDKEAYGESHPAVKTKDGVPLEENRRVVVEFRK